MGPCLDIERTLLLIIACIFNQITIDPTGKEALLFGRSIVDEEDRSDAIDVADDVSMMMIHIGFHLVANIETDTLQ